jgi:hypothetical protein
MSGQNLDMIPLRMIGPAWFDWHWPHTGPSAHGHASGAEAEHDSALVAAASLKKIANRDRSACGKEVRLS